MTIIMEIHLGNVLFGNIVIDINEAIIVYIKNELI